jgi:hypothetical protein
MKTWLEMLACRLSTILACHDTLDRRHWFGKVSLSAPSYYLHNIDF